MLQNILTISSVASFAAVTVSTKTRGTTVVNQDREEMEGITWGKKVRHNTKRKKNHMTQSSFFFSTDVFKSYFMKV